MQVQSSSIRSFFRFDTMASWNRKQKKINQIKNENITALKAEFNHNQTYTIKGGGELSHNQTHILKGGGELDTYIIKTFLDIFLKY